MNLESVFWLHRGQHAFMRLLFRIGLSLPASESLSRVGDSSDTRGRKRSWQSVESGSAYDSQQVHTVISTFVHHLCIVTAKLLQKKEVCNKAGAYSSNRQRSDVMQEYNNVVINFRVWLQSTPMHLLFDKLREILNNDTWLFYVMDHTSIPVTLAHMHAPVPKHRMRQLMQCPHCQASFAVGDDNDADAESHEAHAVHATSNWQ
jgi:hypothetical protein